MSKMYSFSRLRILKQDSVLGTREILLPRIPDILSGPKDANIVISGLPLVPIDSNLDFISVQPGTKAFDAVHTFAVVRQVLNLFKQDIQRINAPGDSGRPKPPKPLLGGDIPISWKWQWESKEGEQPIKVLPYAFNGKNAYYDRVNQSLFFGYWDDEKTDIPTFLCRSYDVVAHETGHAVLDTIRPELYGKRTGQQGAINEAFGDLTALFALLSQLDVCEAVVVASKANLHNKTFFSTVGELMGTLARNADNDLKLSEVGDEVHNLSQVLTGAVYDILAEIFTKRALALFENIAGLLYSDATHVRLLFLAAICFMGNATFAEIAKKMIEYEPNPDYKAIIENEFRRREVLPPAQLPSKL